LVGPSVELWRSWTIIFGVLERSVHSSGARYHEFLLLSLSPFTSASFQREITFEWLQRLVGSIVELWRSYTIIFSVLKRSHPSPGARYHGILLLSVSPFTGASMIGSLLRGLQRLVCPRKVRMVSGRVI